MTVDEAWNRVRDDPTWVPAWKLWSRQVVTGAEGGRLRVELRDPQEEEWGGRGEGGEVWEEEELEAFLQQCEVEAGWRDRVEAQRGEQLAEEWRAWEAEMTMAGIQCPRTEVGTQREVRAAGEQLVERLAPPEVGVRDGTARGARAEGGAKREKRRWRPHANVQLEGQPRVDMEGEEVASGQREVGNSEAQEAEEMAVPPSEGPARSARARPRGRRQRGAAPQAFAVDLVSFNGSGSPQALEAMEVLAARRASLAGLLIQEHHAMGDALADLQAGAKTRGMKLAPCEATMGGGGGGAAVVGVAVPLNRGWGGVFAPRWDFSPRESPGRLAGAWLEAGPRGGMVVLSIWCWPSEGMTPRNVALVGKALEVAAAGGCAWVIGGDFNATPSELMAAIGKMLDRAGAVVRAPERPTCYPAAGRARTLDYFLVDARIATAVSQAEVVEEVRGSPHRAVKVSILGREIGGLVQMVQKPRMFPRMRPVGCPRMPLLPQCGGQGSGEGEGEVTLEEEWRRIAYCIEGELCRECDLVGGDGGPDRSYMGRGEGMRLVLRPMMPPRNMARHGRADSQLNRLMWVLNRLEELVHLGRRRRGGWGADNRRVQWERIVFSLLKPDGCTRKLAELDAGWVPLLVLLEGLRGRPMTGGGGEELGSWATRVREAIDERKGRVAMDRRRAWREWVAEQTRKGGGALHSFTKRVIEHPEASIVDGGERTGSPQAHVEADRAERDKTWQKLAGIAKAPWRGEPLGGGGGGE